MISSKNELQEHADNAFAKVLKDAQSHTADIFSEKAKEVFKHFFFCGIRTGVEIFTETSQEPTKEFINENEI